MGLQERLTAPTASWVLSLYPGAAEAGGCFQASRRRVVEWVPAGSAADPERAGEEAARRARAKVRRYCTANRLNRFGTLTYAGEGCHDPSQLRRDVGGFFRRLRDELDGKPFAYLWVPEWHKSGHGQHVHFAAGRYLERGLVERAWGHGFIKMKLIGDAPVGGDRGLNEARIAAGYLAKYIGKDFDAARRVAGLHRYEVARGFQPRVVGLRGRSEWQVLEQASAVMGRRPSLVWSSREIDDWPGPPAVWVRWG